MAQMFDGELDTVKVGVGRYATPGKRSLTANPTDLDTVDIIEHGCSGCAMAATHLVTKHCALVVPHGEAHGQRIPAENTVRAADLNRLQTARHRLAYAAHGYIGNDVIYNAAGGGATDGADNASQSLTYEVLAASGQTLTLKGSNPKRVVFNRSVLNPNYGTGEPAPDTMRPPGLTDEQWDDSAGNTPAETPPFFDGMAWARFIQQPVAMRLPVGCGVEFDDRSVLSRKCKPMVTLIHPPASDDPDDVTFTVEVDQDVGNAREPFDLADPPPDGKYFASLRWEALYPANWRHFVDYPETVFTRRDVTLATGAIHELRNTAGESTRVLFPGMLVGGDGGFVCHLGVRVVDVRNEFSPVTGLARLRTVEDGDGWVTTLDLRGLETEAPAARVIYYPEAVAGDGFRLPFQATCSNAFPDESYAQDEGWCCGSPESAGFATFRKICWRPNECDGFAVGDRTAHWRSDSGPEIYLPHRQGDDDWWNEMWAGVGWAFEQTSIDPFDGVLKQRGGGFSIASLMGRFIVEAPIVPAVLSKELWHKGGWGERIEWTDTDGNERQRVLLGPFCRQGIDESETGGPETLFDPAADRDHPGTMSGFLPGWTTRDDALATQTPSELAEYPAGVGGAVVGSLTVAPGSFGRNNMLLDDVDGAVVSCSLEEVDAELDAYLMARFPE